MRASVALGLACAAFGFAAAVRVMHPFVPEVVPVLTGKLAYFEQHKDDYSVLLLGTSRIYRQADPDLFDREVLAQTGKEVRSYNLGLVGLEDNEALKLVDDVLAMKPANVKWVLLEVDLRTDPGKKNMYTRRSIYWHDAPKTKRMVTRIWAAREPLGDRLFDLGQQLQAYLCNLIDGGKGSEWFLRAWDIESAEAVPEHPVEHKGYYALDWETSPQFAKYAGEYKK